MHTDRISTWGTDRHTHRHTEDIRTCWAASSQLKRKSGEVESMSTLYNEHFMTDNNDSSRESQH